MFEVASALHWLGAMTARIILLAVIAGVGVSQSALANTCALNDPPTPAPYQAAPDCPLVIFGFGDLESILGPLATLRLAFEDDEELVAIPAEAASPGASVLVEFGDCDPNTCEYSSWVEETSLNVYEFTPNEPLTPNTRVLLAREDEDGELVRLDLSWEVGEADRSCTWTPTDVRCLELPCGFTDGCREDERADSGGCSTAGGGAPTWPLGALLMLVALRCRSLRL